MLEYDLISEEDFDNLPDDPLDKFVALDAICRRSLSRLISNESQVSFDNFARLQYMSIISAAASELGVEGVPFPHNLTNPVDGFEKFLLDVGAANMRIRLQNRTSKLYSVELTNRTKARIEQEINKLREFIINSDIPERKRKSLLKKLDELSEYISDRKRINFNQTMAILTYVAANITLATSFLADAPGALATLTTITSLIGVDKEEEEANTKRLTTQQPLKALPAPPKEKCTDQSLDGEIPF